MPFELRNGPGTFQQAVDILFSCVNRRAALQYLDDFNPHFRTVTDYLTHIREVMQLLQAAGGTLMLSKCTLSDTAVSHLDHAMRPRQLKFDRRNLVALEQVAAAAK